MEQLTINHDNGHSTTYNLYNVPARSLPIAYHADTAPEVVAAIESARVSHCRIRIYLGDTKTGKCWNEENDIFGYVGLSKGDKAYYPLLVHNERSFGGGSLMDHCIIKIKESKGNRVLYQAPNFQQPVITIHAGSNEPGYTHELFIDGFLHARCPSQQYAERLKKKML